MTNPLMSREEVAAHLGIKPEAVRSTLRRYGITEQRGYPREAVENLQRPGQGARTDLPFNAEPPVGTVIRVESGRTFRRTDHHIDFHWMDEHGWYRWSEVRGHANRENGRIIEVCPTHQIPDGAGNPVATPEPGCAACAAWMAVQDSRR